MAVSLLLAISATCQSWQVGWALTSLPYCFCATILVVCNRESAIPTENRRDEVTLLVWGKMYLFPGDTNTHSLLGCIRLHTSPSKQGHTWFMLNAIPPWGTWHLSSKISLFLQTISPWIRAQQKPGEQSSL